MANAHILKTRRRGGGNVLSMGCGVVEFVSREDALNAIATMAESILDGRSVQAREDRVPDESDSAGAETETAVAAKAGKPTGREKRRKPYSGGVDADGGALTAEPTKVIYFIALQLLFLR